MLKLLEDEKLFDPLLDFAARRPWFGTCAGSILMAREVSHPAQRSFALLDIAIERNAYGRQVDSSIRRIRPSPDFLERAGEGDLVGVFIRAPIIRQVGNGVRVLAREQEHPVLVEQGPHLAATFHPELGDDTRVHCLFLEKVRQNEERSG
jgi:5'-phosphate synthase pdxT subunit